MEAKRQQPVIDSEMPVDGDGRTMHLGVNKDDSTMHFNHYL